MNQQIWEDAALERLYPVDGHEASYLPAGKKWMLVWNDEFDGTRLDTSKWGFRTDFWGKHSPTFIGEEGVELDGESHLKMNLIEKDGDFYSSHMQTGELIYDGFVPAEQKNGAFWPFAPKAQPKFLHRYGYYEVRCKQPQQEGWHSAFWIQAPGIGSHPDPHQCGVEVDIMENYRQITEKQIVCGALWNGYGADHKGCGHFRFPYEETADGWHNYALEWTPTSYTFYADGKIVGVQSEPDCPVSHVDQFILLTTEVHNYNRPRKGVVYTPNKVHAGDPDYWQGGADDAIKKAVLPDAFIIDYVRVFDEVTE